MSIRLQKYSYRFAEQVLNSNLKLKNELEEIINEASSDLSILSRPKYNDLLKNSFTNRGWINQPDVFDQETDAYAKFDFLKERIGVEVQFGHPSFMGIDLLKFQIASYSNLNQIDVGVYIVVTNNFIKEMPRLYSNNSEIKWNGSLPFEKVVKYLPHVKSAIQIPIYVIGIDI
ncbi:MAG: restriction endonuclease [Lachnospiraceae bacterium]|nr:restriction endonuclease [Lachnospiraceae bacterium]